MLLTFVLLVALAFYTFRLSARIERLEEQLKNHQNAAPVPTDATHQPRQRVVTPMYPEFAPNPNNYGERVSAIPPSPLTQVAPGPNGPNPFIEWVKQDFLVKLGAFMLLIALGWFVSYAFANNWIGPAGRITIGLLVGVLFLGIGTWRIRAAQHQGSIFTVLGATTVILTMFAARELYDFFTPLSALFIMFTTVVFVEFVSLRYQAERLATAGIILGLVAPLLTASPAPDTLNLFLYLTVIVVGALWVVFLTGWRWLTPVALLGVILWSAPYLSYYVTPASQDIALLFTFGFVALFFVTNIASVVRRPDKQHLPVQIFTALLTVVYLIAWIFEAVSDNWHSLLYSAWALVFAVGAFLVYAHTRNRQVFYIYGGAAVGLIGAATAAELNGILLTIAFTLEIALFIMVAAVLRAPSDIVRNISLLFAIPILMSLPSLDGYAWRDSVLHGDAFVLVLMMLVTLRVGAFLLGRAHTDDNESLGVIGAAFYLVSGFYATALVWLVSHALLPYDLGTTISLAVYTIVGLTLFIQGPKLGSFLLRNIGILFIGGVVARLLLIDIWEMPIAGRIVTFFIIGVMLISTAFIGKRNKSNLTS